MAQWQDALVAGLTPAITIANKSNVTAVAEPAVLLVASQRIGATIFNDCDKDLYLALGNGSPVSATNCTMKVAAGGYFETPFKYTGAIHGMWAPNPTGAARITEVVAGE